MLIDPAGKALLQTGQASAAEQFFHQRLLTDPTNPAHLLGLALAFEARQRFHEARVAIEYALEQDANDPTLLTCRANLLADCEAPHDAIAAYIDLLNRHPDHLAGAHNLGALLYRLGHFSEAIHVHRDTVRRHPRADSTWCDLGQALVAAGQIDAGIAAIQQAMRLAPQQRLHRFAAALALLRAERWAEAWPLYEARWRDDEQPRTLPGRPLWQGQSLAGKHLVVLPEQGLGDNLLFARYLPALIDEARQLTLLVPKPLQALLQASFPAIHVCSSTDTVSSPVDYACPIGSLPLHLLRRGWLTPPASDGYLQPSAAAHAKVEHWLSEQAHRPRCGLIWRGNPQHPQDALRSTTVDRLFCQLEATDRPAISLQHAATPDERHTLATQQVPDPSPWLSNFDLAAALTVRLQKLLTVDTAGANLAGALGIPFCLYSRKEGEWRWNLAERRSPWYKTCIDIRILT